MRPNVKTGNKPQGRKQKKKICVISYLCGVVTCVIAATFILFLYLLLGTLGSAL